MANEPLTTPKTVSKGTHFTIGWVLMQESGADLVGRCQLVITDGVGGPVVENKVLELGPTTPAVKNTLNAWVRNVLNTRGEIN